MKHDDDSDLRESSLNATVEGSVDPVDRTIYLDAARMTAAELGMPHDTMRVFDAALRLGYAIGTLPHPETLVPAVVVAKAVESREAQAQVEQYHRQAAGTGNGAGFLGFAGRAW